MTDRRTTRTGALLCALTLATTGACKPAAGTADTSAPPPVAASSPAQASAQTQACTTLAAVAFDVTTQNAVSDLQGQMNASLNLLPHGDHPLGSDIVTAEGTLVLVDTYLAGKLLGSSDDAAQYQSDADTLQTQLRTVAADCGNAGVQFTADLKIAP